MSNTAKKNEIVVAPDTSSLPLDSQAVESLKNRRALLKEFVSSQLVKGSDYGTIPGVPKPLLLKPGAEKLGMLFNLRSETSCIQRDFDLHSNFCMYTYKTQLFHIPTGNLIAELEGSCNSQEKKYRTRSIYEWVFDQRENKRKKKLVREEPTQIADISNTLMKMAQKRAFVGAMIIATGASDFFTHDLDDRQDSWGDEVASKGAPRSKRPGVKNVSSQVQNPHEERDVSKPSCKVCGSNLIQSKFEDALYCPNYKDRSNGEHTKIPAGGKS